MIQGFERERLRGVWSATPTPLNEDLSLDVASIEPLVEHHVKLDIRGLFVAGSCGEGPWLPDADRRALVREVVKHTDGRMAIAVQVTDNSAARIIDNMQRAAEDGADVAVIAQPFFRLNKSPESTRAMYMRALDACPLPVGIYELGERGPNPIPTDVIADIYCHPRVVMIKDSSGSGERREICLAAREERP
ncbi:MAG: dihydrodipicolinate synthase family protein, partial [Armatimonadetes bacterium]|nr:dihydrodipicolinate synthase family protein [Armatimonadota bacterium]